MADARLVAARRPRRSRDGVAMMFVLRMARPRDARLAGGACCSSSSASPSASPRSSRCGRSSRACAACSAREARVADRRRRPDRDQPRLDRRRARDDRPAPRRGRRRRAHRNDRDADDGAAGGSAEAGREDGRAARRAAGVSALRHARRCRAAGRTRTRCSRVTARSCGPSC